MKRSPVHISSWIFSALTLSVVGLTPLSASGAQETGGATRVNTAVPLAPGNDRIIYGVSSRKCLPGARKLRRPENNGEAAKAVVTQVQTLPDPRLQFGYQRMPMAELLQGAMYGFGQEIPFPEKLRLKGDTAQRDAERLEQEYNPHFEGSPRSENMERLNRVLQDRHLMVTLAISIRTAGQIIQERNS